MKTRIGEIAYISIGYQPRGRVEPDPDGQFRLIQIKDFDGNHRLNPADIITFTPDYDPHRYVVRPGDVLFLSRGHKNWASAMQCSVENGVASGYFFILRIKTNHVLPEYVAWYLNQDPAKSVIRSQARGSHMPIVPKSAFTELEIEVPPIEIQRKIAALAELQHREQELCAALADKRQQLVKHVCKGILKQYTQNEKENSHHDDTGDAEGNQ